MKRKAFTLAEILIVVAILGILASLVIPTFQSHAAEARESAAKDNLRILRTAIERYAARNNGVAPGYPNNDSTQTPFQVALKSQLESHLSDFPKNPFSGLNTVQVLADGAIFPTEAALTDVFGWIYQPVTKMTKLNWSGTDSEGVSFFDY